MSFVRLALVSVLVFGLAGCGSCGRRPGRADAAVTTGPKPTLRIAYLTDIKGYLEPCGCTSRPLGGVHRLGGMLDRLARDGVPTAFVVAGDTFLPGASSEAQRTQDEWQAETLVDVLNALHVAAVVPGRRDLANGEAFAARLRERSRFPWLATGSPAGVPTVPLYVATIGSTKVAFVGVTDAFGASQDALVSAARASVTEARARGARVVVALLRGDRRLARAVAMTPGVDFVIEGGIDSETPEPPTARGAAFALEGGYQGQRLVVLNLYLRDASAMRDESRWTRTGERTRVLEENQARRVQIAEWTRAGNVSASDLAAQNEALAAGEARIRELERDPDTARGNAFVAEAIELAPGAPEDARVAAMQSALAIRVNDHNRRALANVESPPVPEGSATYVGTEACRSCHASAYEWWRHHPHGNAYATLVERHREFNLQCVGCHVTGYGRPGGATVTHNLDGRLVNVGCETCHGPGSLHVSSADHREIRRDAPESTCTTCHNHEHSDHFSYASYLPRVVVPGHGLPIARSP